MLKFSSSVIGTILSTSLMISGVSFAQENAETPEPHVEAANRTGKDLIQDPKTKEQCEKIKGKNSAECAKQGAKVGKTVTLKGAKTKTVNGLPESTSSKGAIDTHN